MSALDYDRTFLFTLSDLVPRASVRDQSYGLLDIDANPKPVYTALKQFLEVSGPTLTPGDRPPPTHGPTVCSASAGPAPTGASCGLLVGPGG